MRASTGSSVVERLKNPAAIAVQSRPAFTANMQSLNGTTKVPIDGITE
jgi:hypothetical protein